MVIMPSFQSYHMLFNMWWDKKHVNTSRVMYEWFITRHHHVYISPQTFRSLQSFSSAHLHNEHIAWWPEDIWLHPQTLTYWQQMSVILHLCPWLETYKDTVLNNTETIHWKISVGMMMLLWAIFANYLWLILLLNRLFTAVDVSGCANLNYFICCRID